ncbi:DNA topoisomerase IB [Labrys monachus]|uniref:DNA topoisomerase-1 n=1 Tax=Labrys monachus TaxID=217067 RepID=A0ABU0FA33_9HYPH|nr:DNA topoisomerase IB [Labrys monachus]MDQ0391482.1 DNA topoisomerase-1 [Labrys monachus]
MKFRLKIVSIDELAITRRRVGRNFTYRDAAGNRVIDPETKARIRSLAIPPAYTDVRIAADERAHIQAVGHDEAGRRQYRYHPEWTAIREDRKAARLLDLLSVLPRIRAAVARDLASRRLDRSKAIACAVALIDQTHIRVGCDAYARENGSHGAATLLKRHVTVNGSRIFLRFRGKAGKMITCAVQDPTIARAMRRMGMLPGNRMLQFLDGAGNRRPISASEINAYLRRVSGRAVTAKDFRMLGASAWAVEHLAALTPGTSETGRKRQIAAVMRDVAEHLANTPAVVRKSYVPALVVQSFEDGTLSKAFRRARAGMHRNRTETVLGLLGRRP